MEQFYTYHGEESAEQIKLRADRLKINNENIMFLGETDIDLIRRSYFKVKSKTCSSRFYSNNVFRRNCVSCRDGKSS